nr:unnamed protein product [Callosobruchus chinensis]
MEVLVRQRGGLKASLTNFNKYLTQIHTIEELSVNDLNKYYSIISVAKVTLNKYKKAESVENRSNLAASSVVSDSQAARFVDPLQGVKLPTINLPDFDGTLENWLEFRDIYESLIHKNKLISEVQRFHYLRSSLTGEPAQLIKGGAWDMLVQRYNNDDTLVHNYEKNLFHMEPIAKESSKSMRNMLDFLNKNLRALNRLQLPTEHWDVLFVFLMASKLDLVTEREWVTFKSKHQDFPKVDGFIKFLNSWLSILETIELSRSEKASESRGFKKRHEIRSFAVTDGSEKVQNCTLCSGQHFIQTCPEFLKVPVSKRAEKVISLILCLNCLHSGHMSRTCHRAVCRKVSEVIFKILNQGCFKLRKFHSNEPKVLDWLETDNDNLSKMVDFGEREHTKTLGLMWCPKTDSLMYRVKELDSCNKVTKTTILSGSSKIFDPLGLVAPCVMQIKILLQSLWLENVSWDDALPGHIIDRWNEFKGDVNSLNDLVIDRHAFCRGMTTFEIHAFCDASEKAYGACVYVESFVENDNCLHLLTAKGKVAPLKTVTLPRLELCGALLAARLAHKVSTALHSTIVLGWIKTPPRRLKTFVGNRVSEIQDLAGTDEWRHVPTGSNPADLLSRGLKASKIRKADIWWHGPKWLNGDESQWPRKPSLPDIRNTNVLVLRQNEKCDLFDRFIENCRANKIDRKMNPLTVKEINSSCNKLVKIAQGESFSAEIRHIKDEKLSSKSRLICLNPFLDDDGYLRVGGRLANSEFNFEKKHPLILAKEHTLIKLLVRQYHQKLLHAGPQHVLASLREKFWILSGRSLVKQSVRERVKCFRFSPRTTTSIMGNLPIERLKPDYPFSVVGTLLNEKPKWAWYEDLKILRGTICMFFIKSCAFGVGHLFKDCFILALRRFISRREKPSHLRSISLNRLDIYQHLQQMKQHIWSRWSKEYVTELQQRCKWKSTQGELKEGDMVIIKEDNLPPLKWKLG